MAFSPLLAGPHLAFRQIFAFACFLTLLYSGAAHEVFSFDNSILFILSVTITMIMILIMIIMIMNLIVIILIVRLTTCMTLHF